MRFVSDIDKAWHLCGKFHLAVGQAKMQIPREVRTDLDVHTVIIVEDKSGAWLDMKRDYMIRTGRNGNKKR